MGESLSADNDIRAALAGLSALQRGAWTVACLEHVVQIWEVDVEPLERAIAGRSAVAFMWRVVLDSDTFGQTRLDAALTEEVEGGTEASEAFAKAVVSGFESLIDSAHSIDRAVSAASNARNAVHHFVSVQSSSSSSITPDEAYAEEREWQIRVVDVVKTLAVKKKKKGASPRLLDAFHDLLTEPCRWRACGVLVPYEPFRLGASGGTDGVEPAQPVGPIDPIPFSTVDPKERTFLLALIDHPSDDDARIVYADWLEEHSRHVEATIIRMHLELAQPCDNNRYIDLQSQVKALSEPFDRAWLRVIRRKHF